MGKKSIDLLTDTTRVTGILPDSKARENMISAELEQIIESCTEAQINGLKQTQKRIDIFDEQIKYTKNIKRR